MTPARTFNDPTIGHINNLQPALAARAFQLVNSCRAAGIPLYISSSIRTVAQQAALVKSGASRTMDSKHLTGRAFDVDVLGYGRDELPRWWWTMLGEYGEYLGMRWGGRFTGFFDGGHFEL